MTNKELIPALQELIIAPPWVHEYVANLKEVRIYADWVCSATFTIESLAEEEEEKAASLIEIISNLREDLLVRSWVIDRLRSYDFSQELAPNIILSFTRRYWEVYSQAAFGVLSEEEKKYAREMLHFPHRGFPANP